MDRRALPGGARSAHLLSQNDARLICALLPADNKLATRQLRQFLAGKGVSIKHTHALRTVAQLRGSPGYLGLGDAIRWEVASWVSGETTGHPFTSAAGSNAIL